LEALNKQVIGKKVLEQTKKMRDEVKQDCGFFKIESDKLN
jgi:hypothetical protein